MDAIDQAVNELKRQAAALGYDLNPEVHIYHHRDDDGPRINVSVEKNSKGYNWTATITGASSPANALQWLQWCEENLRKTYGEPVG